MTTWSMTDSLPRCEQLPITDIGGRFCLLEKMHNLMFFTMHTKINIKSLFSAVLLSSVMMNLYAFEKNTDNFDTGEQITINLFDNSFPKKLKLSAFRGKIRIGKLNTYLLDDYYQKRSKEVYSTRKQRHILKQLNNQSLELYLRLWSIKQALATLNKQQLKKWTNEQPDSETKQEQQKIIAWTKMAHYLAKNALSMPVYAEYFCVDGDCKKHNKYKKFKKQGFSLKNNTNLHSNPIWSGNGDPFEARRSFKRFIDKEFTEIVEWSENHNFNNEIYVVGQTNISDYQFDKDGFYFHITLPYSRFIAANKNHKGKGVFKEESAGKGIFVKVPIEQAKVLKNKVQRKDLHYAIKGILKITDDSYFPSTKILNVSNIQFDFEIISDTFEVFLDSGLTEKLIEIPVSLD